MNRPETTILQPLRGRSPWTANLVRFCVASWACFSGGLLGCATVSVWNGHGHRSLISSRTSRCIDRCLSLNGCAYFIRFARFRLSKLPGTRTGTKSCRTLNLCHHTASKPFEEFGHGELNGLLHGFRSRETQSAGVGGNPRHSVDRLTLVEIVGGPEFFVGIPQTWESSSLGS